MDSGENSISIINEDRAVFFDAARFNFREKREYL